MFGKNVVTKPYPQEDGSLKIHSIWYTIQGEGPDAGCPAIFVRLSHCNLRCYFCDTAFDDGRVWSRDEVSDHVWALSRQHNCKLVVITGGEPFLQNITPFIESLNSREIAVSIETAGTVYIPGIPRLFSNFSINKIVCSPKTPTLSPNLVPHISALKYIIRDGEVDERDGLPCMSTQRPGLVTKIYRPCQSLPVDTPVFVQPMDEEDPEQRQRNIKKAAEVAMAFGYRLSIQLHKLVGVE